MDAIHMQFYRRFVMRSDERNRTERRRKHPVKHPTFEFVPAWRLTQTELRELANRRTRSYEGEVAWLLDAL